MIWTTFGYGQTSPLVHNFRNACNTQHKLEKIKTVKSQESFDHEQNYLLALTKEDFQLMKS